MTSNGLEEAQNHAFKLIGLRIRGLRTEQGVSVFDLARFLQISHNEIDEIEAGSGQLTLRDMLLLAFRFNVDFKWLCRELVDEKAASRKLSSQEIEDQIAMELSKLNPGTVDRVMRSITSMRTKRRARGIKQSPSLIVLKRVQDLVNELGLEASHVFTPNED